MKMFGDRGEKIAQYVVMGKKVAISGKLEHRTWETSAGEKVPKYNILIDDLESLSSAAGGDNGEARERTLAGRPVSGTGADGSGADGEDERVPVPDAWQTYRGAPRSFRRSSGRPLRTGSLG